MLSIKNLSVSLNDKDKEILKGISLSFQPGKTYLLQGKNGSGKSTLGNTVMGNPRLSITSGTISLIDEEYPDYILEKTGVKEVVQKGQEDMNEILLNDLSTTERSLLGIFLANQYPLEIPGVDLSNFLRLAYNAHSKEPIPVFKFRKLLKEAAESIKYPEKLLDRNLNEGFSGGEKKKTEILQLALLSPRYAILDETDSGLDKEALEDVFSGLNTLKQKDPKLCLIVISHYERVLEYFKFDQVIQLNNGEVVSINS